MAKKNKSLPVYKHITVEEREELYVKIMHQLGAPLRKVELTEEMLDTFFVLVLEDYSSFINDWLTEQQWGALQNLDLSTQDVAFAYITKTLDFEKSFSYAYSKQVGLGANAPSEWELKKDYITITSDTQVYTIPANRQINEVLWFTPPMISPTRNADPFAAQNWSAGSFGWSYFGSPAQFMLPSFSILLNSQDRSLKKHILGSDLTYRITAGPNGTKNLYLYPVPGSKYEITGFGGRHWEGAKVWYFYYDTTNKSEDECLMENKDIIKLPTDVPLENLKWGELNSSAKTNVRKLLLAECKKALANIRGKFSGNVSAGDIQLSLDYRILLEQSETEKEKVYETLRANLENITLRKQMEDRANIADNTNRVLSYIPFKRPVIFR